MGGTRDPRAEHAPDSYDALGRLEADVEAMVPGDLLAVARQRVAVSLSQAPWTAPDDVVATFTDKFVLDVTSVELAPLASRLGAEVGPFVQALWVLDLGLRTDLALGRLFGAPCPPRPSVAPSDFSTDFDTFLL